MCPKKQKKFLILNICLVMVYNNTSASQRKGKIFFPIIPFYQMANVARNPCLSVGSERLEGICNTASWCRNVGLMPGSPCLRNGGFCCLDIKNCGGISSSPVVYFKNPAIIPESCSLTVTKTNSSICQLRLDFIDFSLSQPVRGICSNFLQLSIGESYLPKICGENAGQHVYVEFLPNCIDQTLSFKFQNPTSGMSWNIKITQIPCNSPLAAPRGCLQYYKSLTGTVRSFNYGPASVPRQLSPLDYTICILPQYGYCTVKWASSTNSSFALQPPPDMNMMCGSNYVTVLNPDCTPADCPPGNQFCGSAFIEATSSARIFELQVVNRYPPVAQQLVDDGGFSLHFQQIICN